MPKEILLFYTGQTIHIMKKVILFSLLLGISATTCWSQDSKQPKETILENGYYFNGKTFEHFGEIVIKDGKIAAISAHVSEASGNRAPLNGKYVIPVLTDAHMHLSGSPAQPYVYSDPKLNANSVLNCGVTTLIDLFYPEDGCKAIKEETGRSPEDYPTLIMSGPILTAPGGHGTEYGLPTRTITSVAEATRITNEVIAGGVDVIKLVYEADDRKYIPSMNIDEVKAIVVAAHAHHKKVFAHIDLAAQATACAEVGVDVIAHMPADELTDAQLHKIKASGAIIIPTATVLQSLFDGHDAAYMSDSLLWKTANPIYMADFSRSGLPKIAMRGNFADILKNQKYKANIAHCIKAGIPILAGTDAGNYGVFFGYSLHNEIAQYVLAGMTPAQALCTGTENIKLVFPGIKTGKIAVGYDADLVVLDTDPLKDINNTKKINMVLHKGRVVENLIAKLPPIAAVKSVAYDPTVFNIPAPGALPDYINVFTDKKMGGSSELYATARKDASGADCLHITGKIVKKGYMGFGSVGFSMAKTEEMHPTDIDGYTAIEFDVKGNGETYSVLTVSSLVKDYNFHTASFTAPTEWKTVRIPFTDMKQSPYFGKQIALDLKTITDISFGASGKDYLVDMDLKNIHLVR